MGFIGAFIGSPQSKLSFIAIMIAIVTVSISLIFSKDNVPVAQKIGSAFILFLLCIPILLYNLFQITCYVTGKGVAGETWWCGVYAWIIATFITIVSILVVVMTIITLATKKPEPPPPTTTPPPPVVL